jgi:hypothetical protein
VIVPQKSEFQIDECDLVIGECRFHEFYVKTSEVNGEIISLGLTLRKNKKDLLEM